MNFEQAEVLIDFLHQAQALSQHMDGPQPATTHRARPPGDFIMNIAAVEHGPGLIGVILFAQTARDSLLVFPKSCGAGFFHLKGAFLVWGSMTLNIVSTHADAPFKSFIYSNLKSHLLQD